MKWIRKLWDRITLEIRYRKKLKELGTNIMQAKTGMSTGRTVSYSNYSSAGQI